MWPQRIILKAWNMDILTWDWDENVFFSFFMRGNRGINFNRKIVGLLEIPFKIFAIRIGRSIKHTKINVDYIKDVKVTIIYLHCVGFMNNPNWPVVRFAEGVTTTSLLSAAAFGITKCIWYILLQNKRVELWIYTFKIKVMPIDFEFTEEISGL